MSVYVLENELINGLMEAFRHACESGRSSPVSKFSGGPNQV